MFSLRGVELRELKPSQVQRHTDPDRYVYTENVSKTRSGTFKKLHVPNKVVPLFGGPEEESVVQYTFSIILCTTVSCLNRLLLETSSFSDHLRRYPLTLRHLGTVVARPLVKTLLTTSCHECVPWWASKAGSRITASERLQQLKRTRWGYMRRSSRRELVTIRYKLHQAFSRICKSVHIVSNMVS